MDVSIVFYFDSVYQAAIYSVNQRAFKAEGEARLVDLLREQAEPIISLVAEDNGEIVGHILFSPVSLAGHPSLSSLSGHPELKIMGLAPMAVIPERQGQGIGSKLVTAGLEECKKLGFGAVVVLGHPQYYPRFGFKPSIAYGIKSEYDVPQEVFMVKELRNDYLQGVDGVIQYHRAFQQL